jgi:hypothetical protein
MGRSWCWLGIHKWKKRKEEAMERFRWGADGKKYILGEAVRVTYDCELCGNVKIEDIG